MSEKTKDRPYMGMGVLSGGDAAGTTIVGGQPGETRRGARQQVPVGLERVLYAAAAEPEFRDALLADRAKALAARGFELTNSERAVLGNLPAEQLAAMIARLDVSRENLARREFLRNVAGTFVALAAGSALTGCPSKGEQAATQGGAPFLGPSVPPEPQPPYVEPGPPAGIRPDLPEPPEPVAPPAGIRPDVPEPPSPSPYSTGGIRPDRPKPPTIDIDDPGPQPTRGIRPDRPPPAVDIEPPPPPATRGIRPD